MDTIVLDWETYYANDYSLSNMTTEAYVRDSRFEEILVGVKINSDPAFWLLPDRFAAFAEEEVDWENTAVIAHHAHFDGLILSHHHQKKPKLWIDTLPMARIVDGPKAGNSLHDLCIRHGIGTKGDFVTYAKGKRAADFSHIELKQYGDYCMNDCEKEYLLAMLFMDQIPMEELQLIDIQIRMFTEPMFIGDVAKLKAAVATEKARKVELLLRIGLTCQHCKGTGWDHQLNFADAPIPCMKCDGSTIDKKTIRSNEKFANLLRARGVEPETKTSPSTNEQIYAFAKTDPAMLDLLEDTDEEVRFLAEARIGVKSNIIETRAQRFQDCAERGVMPAYVAPHGAHTMRSAGGDSTNWLNISSKHNENRPELSVIADSILAPPGHKIITADSGQGEARITAWLANQTDLVEAFARNDDVYSAHASTIYNRPIDRKHVKGDYVPGQLGKVSILGMGFGMAWFKAAMELLKGMLGAPPIQFKMADLELLQVDPSRFLNSPKKVKRVSEMPSRLELNDRLIHCAVTNAIVERYRTKYVKIVEYWALMEQVIDCMLYGKEMTFGAYGVMRTGLECIYMPNGLKLHYRGLQRGDDGQASYFNGRTRTKIYGGLLTENCVQCLHYIIVSRQLLEIAEILPVKLSTYDDVVCVVPDEIAADAQAFMVQTMGKTPAWATGLPLIGEGKMGNTLKEAS